MYATPRAPLARRRDAGHLPVVGDLVAAWRLLRAADEPLLAKALVVAALVYLVAPVDLIPELAVPVVGWLDDVGFLLVTRAILGSRLDRHRDAGAPSPPRS